MPGLKELLSFPNYIHNGEIDERSATSIIKWLVVNREQKEVTLLFSSFGGDVCHGLAIYDVARLLSGTTSVNIVVLGECKSAGTFVIAAAEPERRYSAPSVRFMIHALTMSKDNGASVRCDTTTPPDEVLRTMELMSGSRLSEAYTLQDRVVEILTERTKLTAEKVRDMFKTDSYFSAEEALEYGLVGTILEPDEPVITQKRRWWRFWRR